MALRDRWPSRTAFIYAAVGSAVGLIPLAIAFLIPQKEVKVSG